MKTVRFLIFSLTLLCVLQIPRPTEARAEVSFDFFYDSLSPYGEWLRVADYGYCWRPTDVDADWSPYADGYWAYTDAGWTWVSYEDYGGIVYHYGRWVRVEDEGWCWVPDYEWGPAWVSWRNNDEYVGWAPLPPEARWQPSVGISVWVDRDCDIGPAYYSFCRVRDFGSPVLRPVIINRIENVTIIRRTVNITNITYNRHYGSRPVIFCGGPNYGFINERASRRIPAMKLVVKADVDMRGFRDLPRGDRRRNFNGQAIGNQLVVTAPVVRPPTDPDFLKGKTQKVVSADKVTRGWSGVKNEDVRKELKQEMDRQTKGLNRDTAPAKAVAANDLKFVPEKGDPNAVTKDTRPDRKDRRDDPVGQNGGSNETVDPRKRAEMDPAIKPGKEPRTGQEKGGRDARDPQAPADGNLKPFNPTATTDEKPKKEKSGQVATDSQRPQGEAMRNERDAAEQSRRNQDAQRQQAEVTRQQRDAAEQNRRNQDAQRQQAEVMRQQRDAAEQGRRNQDAQRQQAEVMRQQRDAVEQNRRNQDAQRQQAEVMRQQRDAVEQNRRNQDAQRQQGEAMRQQRDAVEQNRRNQDAQRQQGEAMRQQRDAAEQNRRNQDAQRQQEQSRRNQESKQGNSSNNSSSDSDKDKDKKKNR